MQGRSVLDEAIAGSGRLGDLHHELIELEHAMGDPTREDYDKFCRVKQQAGDAIAHVCVDVANGYTKSFIEFLQRLLFAGGAQIGDDRVRLLAAEFLVANLHDALHHVLDQQLAGRSRAAEGDLHPARRELRERLHVFA